MQGVVCPTLNPRPAEEDFYNALPEADPTLLPDDAQPEMEEEAEPAREAENLATANVAPSVGQDEGTRQAEPSCSNQVPLPDFHDMRLGVVIRFDKFNYSTLLSTVLDTFQHKSTVIDTTQQHA